MSDLLGEYKYNFRDNHKYTYQTQQGLNEDVVRQISGIKGEPEWMLEKRLRAYKNFLQKPMPNWGADLTGINFDDITYYMRPSDQKVNEWDLLPDNIKETFDKIGVPEAEKKFLAGASAQYESEVVYHNIKKEWEDQGVIFTDMDSAVKQYPEIVKKYFGTIIPATDNKFAALNSSVWSGGSFVYVPKGVHVKIPLQAYFRINASKVGQFERTLIIADEGSKVHYVEGCFTGNTKVKLVDGRELDFLELIEEDIEGKINYAYTIDNNKVQIAEIRKPRLTRINAEIMKVVLDNQEEIKCTLDHKFMLRDGTYKEARFLKAGVSLMPLYLAEKKIIESVALNHKVNRIEFLNKYENVYDLTINGTHNFALAAGVFVHNCSAPTYSSNSLHSAVVELIAMPNSHLRYTTIQNWSNNVYNLVTKRAVAYRNAFVEWLDGNIGSKVTQKYPCVIMKEPGARGEVISVAYAREGQHQDAGAKMYHLAPNTTSRIISKSISQSGGRTSYRGLVKVVKGAKGSKCYVQCDAYMLDEKSRSDTYPTIQIDEENVSIAHEARVGKIDQEKVFYLMSRGIPEQDAIALIVLGFIEPFTKELPLEYALELNRLIQLQLQGAVG